MSLRDTISGIIKTSILATVPGATETNPITHTHDDSLHQACDAIADGIVAYSEYPEWDAGTTYDINIPVSYTDGYIYISKVSGNIGNIPSSSSTQWYQKTPQTLMKQILDIEGGQ